MFPVKKSLLRINSIISFLNHFEARELWETCGVVTVSQHWIIRRPRPSPSSEVGSELVCRPSSQPVNPAGPQKHTCYQVHAIKSVSSVNTVTYVWCVSKCPSKVNSISVCAWLSVLSAHSGTEAQGGRSAAREAVASSQTHRTVKALSASSPPSCQSHKTPQRWTRQHNIDAFSLFPRGNTRSNCPLSAGICLSCRICFVPVLVFALYLSSVPMKCQKEGCSCVRECHLEVEVRSHRPCCPPITVFVCFLLPYAPGECDARTHSIVLTASGKTFDLKC